MCSFISWLRHVHNFRLNALIWLMETWLMAVHRCEALASIYLVLPPDIDLIFSSTFVSTEVPISLYDYLYPSSSLFHLGFFSSKFWDFCHSQNSSVSSCKRWQYSRFFWYRICTPVFGPFPGFDPKDKISASPSSVFTSDISAAPCLVTVVLFLEIVK